MQLPPPAKLAASAKAQFPLPAKHSQHAHRGLRCVVNAVDSSADALPMNAVSVGIDLGTTNSVIAIVSPDGDPYCVPTSDGAKLLPSIIAFEKDGSVLVGDAAKAQASSNPENTFYSVKRLIGKDYDDVKQEGRRLAYNIKDDGDGAVVLCCENDDDGEVYPEEAAAYIIRDLLDSVEGCTGNTVDRAVISVPAYFDEEQREATIAAGQIAGLKNIKLIREPVAAAFSYGLDLQGDISVLVFDLGGGTFDVSILEVGSGVIEVLATGGDADLGGDDWDAAIMRYIEETHLTPFGVDVSNPRVRANLRMIAETAKIRLSTSEKVQLRLPIGGPDGKGCTFTMTRQHLDELSVELFRRCRLPVDQACWQAGVDLGTVLEQHDKDAAAHRSKRAIKRGDAPPVNISPKRREPISEVLLVGGATRMPAVRQFVRNMTGLTPRESAVDPDEAVALGAAIYSGVLSGHIQDLMVMDVWQASLMRALAAQQFKEDPELAERIMGDAEASLSGERPAAAPPSDDDEDDDDESLGEIVSDELVDELVATHATHAGDAAAGGEGSGAAANDRAVTHAAVDEQGARDARESVSL